MKRKFALGQYYLLRCVTLLLNFLVLTLERNTKIYFNSNETSSQNTSLTHTCTSIGLCEERKIVGEDANFRNNNYVYKLIE